MLNDIQEALLKGKKDEVEKLVTQALEAGIPTARILNEGLITGMERLGVLFKNNEVFIPEVLVAARAMHAGLAKLEPYLVRDEAKIAQDFPKVGPDGRRYKTAPLHAPQERHGETGRPWRGLMPPPGNHWRYVHAALDKLDEQGRVEWSSTGNPREKVYADESMGMFLQDIWLGVKDGKGEYPSMKNPELRI